MPALFRSSGVPIATVVSVFFSLRLIRTMTMIPSKSDGEPGTARGGDQPSWPRRRSDYLARDGGELALIEWRRLREGRLVGLHLRGMALRLGSAGCGNRGVARLGSAEIDHSGPPAGRPGPAEIRLAADGTPVPAFLVNGASALATSSGV